MKTYKQALSSLYQLRLFGTKLGLNNIRKLLEILGDPQENLVFYHIAGTNGKGSTAAILQALLRTTHRRVGLFTSPHLVNFRERIRINDRLIGRREVMNGLRELFPLFLSVAESPGCSHPTYFEAVTALACRYFQKMGADAVVWEVGLGGRLDATNAIRPRVSIITNIDLEHQQYLGDSIDKITREKGGIIKEGVPLVTAASKPAAISRLKKICRSRQAPIVEVGKSDSDEVKKQGLAGQLMNIQSPRRFYPDMFLPLTGNHQRSNCRIALAAWEQGDPQSAKVPLTRIRGAIRQVKWPGRFEYIPGRPEFILDGAHNRAGALACAETLRIVLEDRPIILIIGVLGDKDVESICYPLVPLARKVIAVQPGGERGLSSFALAQICRRQTGGKKIPVLARKYLESAIGYCYRVLDFEPGKDQQVPLVCITGSLRLIGEAREILGRKRSTGKLPRNNRDASTDRTIKNKNNG
ncbi:MAG: folylpolyglutamate synthase/dihydrofolate synthase family protein [Candidatus Auribacterota bacterium]|nr:folylpolyglutamate synthase/dihydrofolate synthase family protein [Candidatus Auribacterota bacterium]